MIVPSPGEKPDEKDNPKRQGIGNSYARIDRKAGAWLLERFIERVGKLIEEENKPKEATEENKKPFIEVKGYLKSLREERDATAQETVAPLLSNLKADKWGRAVTVRELAAIETEAYDLVKHALPGTEFYELLKCQHVLVRGHDGVHHLDRAKDREHKFDYYFRPFDTGPEYNPRHYGSMSGHEKILITSIVKEMLAQATTSPSDDLFASLNRGICLGLRLWAKHFEEGLGSPPIPPEYFSDTEDPHPFDHLFEVEVQNAYSRNTQIGGGKSVNIPPVAWLKLPFPLDSLETWSRVSWLRERSGLLKEEKFEAFLVDVVKKGLKDALKAKMNKDTGTILCPLAKIGKLEIVDRDEIDGFLDLYVLIQKYLDGNSWKTPLSLAVFGPPGSGKSFAVKEILKAARLASERAGIGEDPLVYNLAEFTSPSSLTIAFHQAQDRALSRSPISNSRISSPSNPSLPRSATAKQ